MLEHEPINVSEIDFKFLKKFVPDVLKFKNGDICASNYVGVLRLPSGGVLEVLPKVSMTDNETQTVEEPRQLLLNMLRSFRGLPKDFETADIRALKNFNMLSYFIRQFLNSLTQLVREGVARQYITDQDNLPYLKGRIEFKEHLRQNSVNRARFYTSFNEFSVNRPVNRLIVTTLDRLEFWVGYSANRKLLKDLQIMFATVPRSENVEGDWNAHIVDRSMSHYTEIMKWIVLFLFRHGLATYSGRYANIGLMFPMEKIFEDFVTAGLRQHTVGFQVCSQGPQRPLVYLDKTPMFYMQPDITLQKHKNTFYVLDAKWKELDGTNATENFLISQSDLYQLYTYGMQYTSKALVLIYPMNANFREPLRFQFTQGIPIICFPFDVRDTQSSVNRLMKEVIRSEVA